MPLSKIVLIYEPKVSLNPMVLIKLHRYQFFQLLFECIQKYIKSMNPKDVKDTSKTLRRRSMRWWLQTFRTLAWFYLLGSLSIYSWH